MTKYLKTICFLMLIAKPNLGCHFYQSTFIYIYQKYNYIFKIKKTPPEKIQEKNSLKVFIINT